MGIRLPTKLACAIVLSSLTVAASAHAAPAPLTLGIQDPLTFQGNLSRQQRGVALDHAAQSGAAIVRLGVAWRDIETTQPPSRSAARGASWSGYHWDEYDREIRDVRAAGMEPMLVPAGAPDWDEGAGRPSGVLPGSWRPNAKAFGDFTHALAARYNGTSKDDAGQTLPRVRYFQAWNEPNLSDYLSPQSTATKNGRAAASPGIFRGLVNAMYGSVKAVHGSNVLVAGGLAPFGTYPPLNEGGQLPPLFFMRKLLCVNTRGTHAGKCPRVHFDGFALHLYPLGDPRRKPLNADDLVGRLRSAPQLLRLAARAGTISSRQAKLWVTEFSLNGGSDPQWDLPLATQASYLSLGLYLLWRDAARVVLWYDIRDRAGADFIAHAGLFTLGDAVEKDKPKPARDAFRFPFFVPLSNGRRSAWGLAPSPNGSVVIEQANGKGGWKRIARFAASRGRVFSRPLPKSGPASFRARQGRVTSLPYGPTSTR